MTPNELSRRFPRASAAFIRANCDSHPDALPSRQKPQPKPPLEAPPRRAKTGSRSVEPRQRYAITFIVYACHPRDWDNLAASCKELQDELVKAGWLPNDDWKTLDGRVRSRKAHHEAEERTVIEITNL